MHHVTIETGRLLKEAGFPQALKGGDQYYSEVGQRQMLSLVEFDNAPGPNVTKLPTLSDLLEEIERRIPNASISFTMWSRGRLCTIAPFGRDAVGDGEGPNDTEAAALALLKVMEVG